MSCRLLQKKEKESKQIEFDTVCKFLAETLGKDKVSAVEVRITFFFSVVSTGRLI